VNNHPTENHVFINQLGYLPTQRKIVISDLPSHSFEVIKTSSGETVYSGLMTPAQDATSNQTVWQGDFSALTSEGTYLIRIDQNRWSFPFPIDTHIYHHLFELSTRFYYLQRCGVSVNDKNHGLFHPACHVKDGFLPVSNTPIHSTGGWHDAGDYGKYASTTTITVALMLTLYELWPKRFYDGQLHIPESGNGRPDLLDEALVGLEWLLTLQRPDGGIYRKLAGAQWPDINTLPEADTQDRYLFGTSTADTAKFAATMSIAARVWQTIDPALAQTFSKAAMNAWEFLNQHQDSLWEKSDQDEKGSGPYYYADDTVDRIWAALEMAILTQTPLDESTLNKITQHQPASIGWEDPSLLGYFHYAKWDSSENALKQVAINKITALADQLANFSRQSGYGYTLHFKDFIWASNKEGLSRGITLILADHLVSNPEYRQIAESQLHFVLGLNPLSKSFVTCIGSNPVQHPHHRWVVSGGRMVPGMLVGGPNNNADSKIEPAHKGPWSYVDQTESYSSNEPAIDYNAALMFMSGFMLGD